MRSPSCDVLISASDYAVLMQHLFPGDGDEHGAVLQAGITEDRENLRLLIRQVHIAKPGTDWVKGKIGYRALHPTFIHRLITSCRDQRLAYLAVHNHHADLSVSFSSIDIESHERGYPALLDIAGGMPVGALVLGQRSMQADVWTPTGHRLQLRRCRIIGSDIRTITSAPERPVSSLEMFDRQIRMFGAAGQQILKDSKVAVIGLGGVGSLIAEYLGRLGVGHLVLIDPDVIEGTNLSRVVGATWDDVATGSRKTDIALRHLKEASREGTVVGIAEDVAKPSVARELRSCDFIFLAADSMRARLVFNAVVHQYLIPGTQIGAKIRATEDGLLEDAMSAVRQVRPGAGCLWCNQLIDPTQLAVEAKSDEERRAQAYGTQQPNPSVLTLNAVAAAHAVNDFLFDFLGLRAGHATSYKHFHFLRPQPSNVQPRKDEECRECSLAGRYAMGDALPLPTFEAS